MLARAALDGLGLALLFELEIQEHLESGALVPVLDDWTPPFAGFHIFYPNRRHLPPALRALIDHLTLARRHSGPG